MKAQESLDKFTGAQEAAPAVVVNLGYDPLEQFRTVVQSKIKEHEEPVKVIDVESVADDVESE